MMWNSVRQQVLSIIAYFDLFKYPITKAELISFMKEDVSNFEVNEVLHQLLEEDRIFLLGNFLSLQSDSALADRRICGNRMATGQLRIAARVARVLSHLPFVKCLAISGSLSKNFADVNSDIDFFIITTKNRLWICRTIMHLLKKISFVAGKQHWFCMNYYIDQDELLIREKNIFTAMEIATLIPMYGSTVFLDFLKANNWMQHFFPRRNPASYAHPQPDSNPFLKKWLEKILGLSIFDGLEKKLRNMTANRWQQKTIAHKVNSRGILMAMDCGAHFAKPHPQNFQEKLLATYAVKLKVLEEQSAVVRIKTPHSLFRNLAK